MRVINVEIKARCGDPESIRDILTREEADFRGTDRQVDTYFPCSKGRLKLREGNIENNLIYYERSFTAGPKTSHCMLHSTGKHSGLKEILSRSLGIRVIVEKQREIYFLGNIKIHLDRVKGLGSFLELEAVFDGSGAGLAEQQRKLDFRMEEIGVREVDLVAASYEGLLAE